MFSSSGAVLIHRKTIASSSIESKATTKQQKNSHTHLWFIERKMENVSKRIGGQAIEERWLINVRVNNFSLAFCKLPNATFSEFPIYYCTISHEKLQTPNLVITSRSNRFDIERDFFVFWSDCQSRRQIWSSQLTQANWSKNLSRESFY